MKTNLHTRPAWYKLFSGIMLLLLAACGGGSGGNGDISGDTTGWQTAQAIDAGDGYGSVNAQDLSAPALAVAANGSAIAIWVQADAGGIQEDLWARTYHPDDGWGLAQVIESGDAEIKEPSIAMAADGSAIAVWIQDGDVWANRYQPGVGWDTVQVIDSEYTWTGMPRVAMAADGSAIAVWRQGNVSGGAAIWVNHYDPTGGWDTARKIGTDDGDDWRPDIAMAPDGSAVAVWYRINSGVGSTADIWANRYDPTTGAWGTAQKIESGDGYAEIPRIAMAADGSAIAVWSQLSGGVYNIWANRYDPVTSRWGMAQRIESGGGSARYADIAMATDGSAIAVWEQRNASDISDIWTNRYDPGDGNGWSVATLIDTEEDSATNPSIAIDPDGSALAIWNQYGTWVNRYEPGTGWGTAQRLGDGGAATGPLVAFDGEGNAIAIWLQYDVDNSIWELWTNRWLAPQAP